MENLSVIQIVYYIIAFGLFFLSYWAKGNMDYSAKGCFSGSESHKNKSNNWENKYAYPLRPYRRKWYYFGLVKPKQAEAFPYSSTILVFLTDYWHFQQFIFLNSSTFATYFLLEGCVIKKLVLIALIQIMYAIGFNTSYERRK